MTGLIFRWLVRITAGLLAASVVLVVLIYWFASRSLPDYDATVRVSGPSAPIEIVRDNANVPHIFGETNDDVFFALGFAHAQDRLWQMTMLRRTAQGRLSELFGTATLDIDTFVRRLDIYALSNASVEHQTPEARAMLDAYAAGVNARINQVNEEALGRGAPEMWLFNHAISPWTPADSISIAKLMGLQLSGHMQEEILLARISLVLSDPSRIEDLMPDTPGAGIAALPEYAALMKKPPVKMAEDVDDSPVRLDAFWRTQNGSALPSTHPLSPFRPRGLSGASNAWAADPTRSASGGTLLANDPHLGFSAPAIWYLARLELKSGGVIGGTIPGMPVVLAGRSADLGWGLTTAYADDQDVVLEELNPENSQEYRTAAGWAPFKTRETIVRIKDAQSITLKLRWTENGPVIPGSVRDMSLITPPGHVAALRWTVLSPRDTSLSAAHAIMRETSVRGAIDAMETYVAPVQNLTLADKETVALKTIGVIPKRNASHRTKGRLPAFGYMPANAWEGRMPYASNPEFVAPIGGILGNTNNKTVDRPFPSHVSFSYGDTQRVLRWQRLMQTREVHTRDSFIEAQLDTVSPTARSLLPLIGADLWFTGEAAPRGTPERQRQRALTLLAEWNGEMNEHWPEPLLYMAWIRALQDRLIHDDLGPLADEFKHVEPLFIERVFRDVDGAAVWCDVRQSAPVETCTDMARLALDDALVWIAETWGTQIEGLRWGDAHQATHDHQVLGEVPVLRYFVNIRQSTSGGDNTLLRGKTAGEGPDPFRNVHGAGYRGVYDFADPNSSVFVISTGQSGHFLSRHYDDLAQLWRRGEYIPMSLDPELSRAASVGVTRLVPR